jgi:hypothetical protein
MPFASEVGSPECYSKSGHRRATPMIRKMIRVATVRVSSGEVLLRFLHERQVFSFREILVDLP